MAGDRATVGLSRQYGDLGGSLRTVRSTPGLRTTSEGVPINSPRSLVASAFVAFAAFGSFWGVWGASVPRVQHQADVSDGQLGFALLFVGAGALPAMLLAGRALDRWGPKVAAGAISLLGIVGAGLALTAVNLPSLCVGLGIAGASSGAADVTMNAVAGRAEKISGRPVLTRVHGAFSSFVVLTSLGAGIASAASLPLAVPFIGVAALCLVAGAIMLRAIPAPNRHPRRRHHGGNGTTTRPHPDHPACAHRRAGRAGVRERERPPKLERGLRPGRTARRSGAQHGGTRRLRWNRRDHAVLDREPQDRPHPNRHPDRRAGGHRRRTHHRGRPDPAHGHAGAGDGRRRNRRTLPHALGHGHTQRRRELPGPRDVHRQHRLLSRLPPRPRLRRRGRRCRRTAGRHGRRRGPRRRPVRPDASAVPPQRIHIRRTARASSW